MFLCVEVKVRARCHGVTASVCVLPRWFNTVYANSSGAHSSTYPILLHG